MSIVKPTLSNPWASSSPGNIASPGGANETGIPYPASKSIPGRWLNWILNKVDTATRYLVARGLPDYDSSESYSVGDRVQWGSGSGMTFVCIVASVGDGSGGNSPGLSPDKWSRWARGLQDYNGAADYQPGDTVLAPSDGSTYRCILANDHGSPKEPHVSPTYWKLWGHTDAEIAMLITLNSPIDVTVSSGIPSGMSISTGTIYDVMDIRFGTSTLIRDLSFRLDGIPSVPGYVDVTLASPLAFGSRIMNIQVTGAVPPSATPPFGRIISNNQARVYASNSGGPSSMAFVRLLGY